MAGQDWTVNDRQLSLVLALALDALLGDPPNRYHPVAWMGSAIGWAQRRAPEVGTWRQLAYGGLKPETVRRLEKLGEELDGGKVSVRKRPANDRPVSGTRLIRDYQGTEHCVTVRDDDFEYQGRSYKSLSAIARANTGTQWNGPVFFGLKTGRRA